MGEGQRPHWSRSNKDSKERQVGSLQCQVASLALGDSSDFSVLISTVSKLAISGMQNQ